MVATRSSTRSASGAAAATTTPASNNLEIDPVSKARTITHMNKDHAGDLSAILRHRAGLTEAQAAANPELLDLDLATMAIRTSGDSQTTETVHTVAIDPPMTHWNDRRARLVAMTLEARKALGLSISAEDEQEGQHAAAAAAGAPATPSTTIQWYPPEGADLVPFSGVLFDYVASLLVFTGHIVPGSALWRLLDRVPVLPGGPAGFAWAVTTALPLFVGIHLLEMVWFDRTRLAPAGVKRGSKVWCQWLGCQLIDGFATFQRWDRRVGKGAKGAKSL